MNTWRHSSVGQSIRFIPEVSPVRIQVPLPIKAQRNAAPFHRPVGQVVKTPPFHGGNMGSSPVRVTKANKSEPYLPGWRWVRILLYFRAISSRQPEAEKAQMTLRIRVYNCQQDSVSTNNDFKIRIMQMIPATERENHLMIRLCHVCYSRDLAE